MSIKTTTKLALILTFMIIVFAFSGCERLTQVFDSQAVISVEERDHLWPVDQNGIEMPIPGTWVLISHTHLNSTSTIGESFTLPADPQPLLQTSDGSYTDGEGFLWTKIRLITAEEERWQFLERVDTSVSPHQLHIVVTVDENGIPILEYGEYPFDLPKHNVQIWEKQ